MKGIENLKKQLEMNIKTYQINYERAENEFQKKYWMDQNDLAVNIYAALDEYNDILEAINEGCTIFDYVKYIEAVESRKYKEPVVGTYQEGYNDAVEQCIADTDIGKIKGFKLY